MDNVLAHFAEQGNVSLSKNLVKPKACTWSKNDQGGKVCRHSIQMLYETNMKEWSSIKEEFGADGSLRDIYVEEIDPALWEIFIEGVKSSVYRHEFTHGGVLIDFPNDLTEVKRLQETNPTTLAIWLGNKIQVNCHFFVETEIELDISPCDIVGEHEYQVLVVFLEWISKILKNRVILTHENTQDQVILSVG